MARIRTIKPEFWKHEDLSELPEPTHMLAAALLNHADDEGYFNANPGLVRAECSPLREPSVSIQDSLKHLSNIGYIRVGTGSDGKRYGHVVKFDDHQRVNRPTPSKIKELQIVWDNSLSAHEQLTESSPPERKGKEGKGTGKGKELLASGDALPEIVLTAYHDTLPNCERVQVLSPKRIKRIQGADKLALSVCRQQGWEYEPKEFWESYFGECLFDPWLRGDVPNPNNANWKQNLAVLIEEERFAGIMDRAITRMRTSA